MGMIQSQEGERIKQPCPMTPYFLPTHTFSGYINGPLIAYLDTDGDADFHPPVGGVGSPFTLHILLCTTPKSTILIPYLRRSPRG